MGAGCSSPLRRFGGKKSKPTNRDSISIENNEALDQITIAARIEQQEREKEPTNQDSARARLNLENEITIQSEAGDDHPSSASYYTDGRAQEDNKTSSAEQQPIDSKASAELGGRFMGPGAAYKMGLIGCVQHDRHLLVSPALSPAPSVCQSPAPNSSIISGSIALDLNDLNEAFKTLTFGLPDNQLNKQRITQPERPQSELHNIYSHQLVQNPDDLTNFITVIFISFDNSSVSLEHDNQSSSNSKINNFPSSLAANIASCLRSICDAHSFNLRFINLSSDHLSRNILVNNLQDVAMNIFKREYKDNCERFIVIMLANGNSSINRSSSSEVEAASASQSPFNYNSVCRKDGRRLLPTKIDAQLMTTLMELDCSTFDQKAKDLLKVWYNQVGNLYYLNPVYSVNADLLCDSKDGFSKGWKNWVEDSSLLINALTLLCDNNDEMSRLIPLVSFSDLFLDFVSKDGRLLKRTLLIRNYPQSSSIMTNPPQVRLATIQSTINNKGSLSELVRQLPDPNKLTIKRVLSDQELTKSMDDWITDNFNKYVDSFLERRIVHCRYPPPFIVKNLFVELTHQRHHLEHYLDKTTDGFESKCQNFYNNQIRPILTKLIDGATNHSDSDTYVATTTTSGISGSRQSLNSQPSANHLVLISGPKGCGKTTLFAQILRYVAQDLINKVQIIYRFCGATLDSLTPNRLLLSICEQFCQAQGENTAAASYIYSSRRDIMNSLNKIIKQQECLIFLDGLDSIGLSDNTGLDWLCELEASSRIKIFITLETNSSLYMRTLESYTDATYISLDDPATNEWAQMLTHAAKSKRFNCASNLYDEIKNLGSNDLTAVSAITYCDVNDVLNMCRIRRLNNEQIHPELCTSKPKSSLVSDYKNIIHQVLKHLHYLLAPHQIFSFFLVIDSSRHGLTEHDLIEIMDVMISHMQQKYPDTRQLKFSSSLLSYMKIQLKPWFKYIVCDKTVKLSLRRSFLSKAIEFYSPSHPKLMNEVREVLLDYFSRPFNQTKHKSSSRSLDILPRVNVSRAEAIWLETQVSETTNLLLLTNPTKAKEYIMNKDHFYLQFLHRSNPEEFLEDYDRLGLIPARKSSQTNEELLTLVNFIRQSIFPLRYDGSQIYSQIYCRSNETNKLSFTKSKSKKFNDILNSSSCPPISNLLPISEASINSFIKTRIGLNEPPAATASSISIASIQSSGTMHPRRAPSSQQTQRQNAGLPFQAHLQQSNQKIFTITDNHRHVIVIYPEKNCLSVWDLYEEKAVRIINNLDQPRDLRMIDQKRAVVLCNRELRVYDLDSGQLLTKLKGVMNQKMPYFEVFGQDYVIALARNRMYVNMLNLNTGELETTFKVGEDRFLNSLLVSANGGICVCGDETQKPFPLLVWNLNERRLMYDLRLDRHEFITKMSAISDDGHFVVSVCKQLGAVTEGAIPTGSVQATGYNASQRAPSPNFIVIYDLNSGTLFKKWKPGLDTCAVAISLSSNRSGKVMNTIVDNTILVWDLATGSRRHTLVGHSAPADVITVQNNRLFSMDSTCRDQSLRIWDIEEGYCLAVFSPDAPVSCCQLSIKGDALVCGFSSETRLSTLVVCKNESVGDVVKRNKRRKSSKSLYIFDESPTSPIPSS